MDGKYHVISYCLAWIFLCFCVAIVVFHIFHWLQTRKSDKIESEKYFSQLYDGLKPKFVSRSYSIIMLIRRIIFIYIALFSQIDALYTVLILFIIQFLYLTTMIVLRSYEEIKDNLIDIINETVYIVCISLLFHYNKASRWTKAVESAFIYLLLSSTFVAMIIVIIFLVIKLKSANV